MLIDRNDAWRTFEQFQIVVNGTAEVGMGQRILQVAHVMRHDGAPFMQQAKRILQFTAERQHRRCRSETLRQRDRCRSETARAAQHTRRAQGNAHHRIIHPPRDVAIMQQEIIGNCAEAKFCLIVVNGLRLVRQVAAGQHNRARHAAQHQVMQQRIGQHETQRTKAGGNAGRDADIGSHVQQHNRRGRTL